MKAIQRKYKTVVQRLAAGIIDGVIFIPFSILLENLVNHSSKTSFLISTVVSAAVPAVYNIILHHTYGQTIGKRASNIKVYALDEKNLLSYNHAFRRELIGLSITFTGTIFLLISDYSNENLETAYNNFVFYPSVVSLAAEIITMFLNDKRRALHDLLAGSVILDITKYRKWDFEYEKTLDE
jgi:uncharacterized RDD family membrane protein YckC